MKPLHAAPLAFWLIPCLSFAMAQTVVKLESPTQVQGKQQPQEPGGVLRVGAAAVGRLDAVKHFPAAVPAIDLGLKWLLAHQDEDGRWSAERFMQHDKGPGPATDGPGNAVNDIGVSALAVLALAREGVAGAGERHDAIARGAKWLVEQQDDKQKGRIGTAAAQGFVYSHAIATFALCAAHAATGDTAIRDAAQKAIAYLEHHRNPFGVWRYQAREPDGDTSVTTWAVLALRAGEELGLKVDPAATKTAVVFIDAVTDPANGRVGYTKCGEGSSRPVGKVQRFPPERAETLTAAGIMCRQALGQPADAPPVVKGKDRLLDKLPAWTPADGNIDHCYWFFGTEAMRGIGGDARSNWGKQLVDALVKGQRVDGAFAGSWDPIDAWGEEGGRVYSTALSVLALQALYGGTAPPKPAAK